MTRDGRAENRAGWALLHPDDVPDKWRDRAVPMVVVPFLPGEAAQLMGGQVTPELTAEDETLARLTAAGLSIDVIAARLGISHRSVQRRLARLRARFGVDSKAELAGFLARRGL